MARDAAEGISAFIEKRSRQMGGPLMTVAAALRNRDWMPPAHAAWALAGPLGLTMGLGLPL